MRIKTIIFALASFGTAFAQTRLSPMVEKPQPSAQQAAKEFYALHPVRPHGGGSAPTQAMFLAYLDSRSQSFGYGDTWTPRLVVIEGTAGVANAVRVYGQILTPGPLGYFDGSTAPIYFQPDNGNYGMYRGGFGGDEVISLASYPFGTQSNFGEYLLFVNIVNADTNQQIQGLTSRVYLNQVGSGGKGQYNIDSVQNFTLPNNASYSKLLGTFPKAEAVHVFVGLPRFSWSQGTVTTNQAGTELVFGTDLVVEPGYRGPQRPADLILCYQNTECVTMSKMFWFVNQQPAAAISQQ